VPTLSSWVLLGGASVLAGAINSIAGGGSLVAFPAAMAAGLSPIVANATNAVGLLPGSLTAAWAYRRELASQRVALLRLLAPAALGGVAGSLLTPQRVFDSVVPLLLLFATALLVLQNLRRPAARGAGEADERAPFKPGPFVMLLQLLVAVYGGYFGAGMGIMMLALFEATGGGDINQKNALKTVLGSAINGMATVWFLFSGVVDLRAALLMAAASSVGGLAGAHVARRADPRKVR
jgi:uncharacterized protein